MSKLEVWKQVWIFDSTVAFYCPCRWPRTWQFLLFSSKCQLLSKLFPTSLNDMLMSSVRAQIIIRFCNWDNGSRPVRKSNFGPWCWMGGRTVNGKWYSSSYFVAAWDHLHSLWEDNNFRRNPDFSPIFFSHNKMLFPLHQIGVLKFNLRCSTYRKSL